MTSTDDAAQDPVKEDVALVSTDDTKVNAEAPVTPLVEHRDSSLPAKRPHEDAQDQLNNAVTNASTISPKPLNSMEAPASTSKKSRKLQGVGVKKPLYSKYESLFIIKAYQKILKMLPNLILIDIFKIICIVFNKDSIRKGSKKRTSDQLYQKYKRIQYGFNHGEAGSDQLEFLKFFKRNKYNAKEWFPIDFESEEVQEEHKHDEDFKIIQSIHLEGLDEAIEEVLNKTNYNPQRADDTDRFKDDHEDELLKLAGYKESNANITFQLLQQQIEFQNRELLALQKLVEGKDQEIIFLKNMVKEDLSYIRHRVNDK